MGESRLTLKSVNSQPLSAHLLTYISNKQFYKVFGLNHEFLVILILNEFPTKGARNSAEQLNINQAKLSKAIYLNFTKLKFKMLVGLNVA